MTNLGLRMDCNTVFCLFGTFQMLTQFRPSYPYLSQAHFKHYKKYPCTNIFDMKIGNTKESIKKHNITRNAQHNIESESAK